MVVAVHQDDRILLTLRKRLKTLNEHFAVQLVCAFLKWAFTRNVECFPLGKSLWVVLLVTIFVSHLGMCKWPAVAIMIMPVLVTEFGTGALFDVMYIQPKHTTIGRIVRRLCC